MLRPWLAPCVGLQVITQCQDLELLAYGACRRLCEEMAPTTEQSGPLSVVTGANSGVGEQCSVCAPAPGRWHRTLSCRRRRFLCRRAGAPIRR